MRICDFLAEHHVAFETLPHAPAFTSQTRARHLGVSGRQVAKGVLLVGPDGRFLAVLPATHRVDTEGLSRHLEGPVRLANDEEITAIFCDCEWGVVSPFGALYGVPTVLDESLPADAELVFEAHSHGLAIRMSCRDFERLFRPRRLRLARSRVGG